MPNTKEAKFRPFFVPCFWSGLFNRNSTHSLRVTASQLVHESVAFPKRCCIQFQFASRLLKQLYCQNNLVLNTRSTILLEYS
jgi:hypothetical protein